MKKILLMAGLAIVFRIHAGDINIFDYKTPDDVTREYRYTSETVPKMDDAGWNLDGKLIHTPVRTEMRDGNRVLVINNQSVDLLNFPTDYETFFIEKDDGYYSAYADDTGKLTEYLILPVDVEVGSIWQTSEFWDNEELEAIVDISTPAGEFKNCVQIRQDSASRTELSEKVGERLVAVTINCPGIGMVRSVTTNTIGAVGFQTVTTVELISLTKN